MSELHFPELNNAICYFCIQNPKCQISCVSLIATREYDMSSHMLQSTWSTNAQNVKWKIFHSDFILILFPPKINSKVYLESNDLQDLIALLNNIVLNNILLYNIVLNAWFSASVSICSNVHPPSFEARFQNSIFHQQKTNLKSL